MCVFCMTWWLTCWVELEKEIGRFKCFGGGYRLCVHLSDGDVRFCIGMCIRRPFYGIIEILQRPHVLQAICVKHCKKWAEVFPLMSCTKKTRCILQMCLWHLSDDFVSSRISYAVHTRQALHYFRCSGFSAIIWWCSPDSTRNGL